MSSAKGKNIFVTQPSLPPIDEFYEHLRKIWDSKYITNNGPYLHKFEKRLCEYLGVPFITVVSNGTMALLIAIKALELSGKIITTPFSFVATTHAIKWSGLKPVFCDITEDNLNLDPAMIEKQIDSETSAILPVHVFGQPCDVQTIQKIAEKYGLRTIYDAAHCFGVNLNGSTVLNHGDLSILSFHATKSFNSIEGGAIVSYAESMKDKLDQLRNFGYDDNDDITMLGINAKLNEIQSAYGIIQLKYIEEQIEKRKKKYERYISHLSKLQGITILPINRNIKSNFSYFPILINPYIFGLSRDDVYYGLQQQGIHTRRYFYPLISNIKEYSALPSANKDNLSVANELAEQILCLPIYENLEEKDQMRIIHYMKNR